jgi:hypothetical protein
MSLQTVETVFNVNLLTIYINLNFYIFVNKQQRLSHFSSITESFP